MIKFDRVEVVGWEHAIRGMRNPLESWERSDSYKDWDNVDIIGSKDMTLMNSLAKNGAAHAKYRRMIVVYADITAPLYWWKEFDTYKVGTVANSCSTMHCIHKKEFTMDDFSHEHLFDENSEELEWGDFNPTFWLKHLIPILNQERLRYLNTNDKKHWWQMIQLLPSSYNQKRTVMMNYEVLTNIYHNRKGHKLDEWRDFCWWIEGLYGFKEIILP